ncbi:hypothetical protein ACFO4N_08060 [Camelliibacillus cellulosilyticus]|uniref:Uncharacterized protein n=1 Tax=Camelliibacillus cellulosilyticus TaxID=2174486 RepID=A0ABV9GN51_9BACL
MGFLEWFYDLRLSDAVLLVVGVMGIHLIYSMSLQVYLKSYYKKSKSPELTLRRLQINRSIYQLFLVLTAVFFFVLIPFQIENLYWYSPSEFYIEGLSLTYTFILIICLGYMHQLILFKTIKNIRGLTIARKEQLGNMLRVLLLVYLPFYIILLLFLSLQTGNYGSFFMDGSGFYAMLMLFVVIIFAVVPMLLGRILKSKPLPDSELKTELVHLFGKM